jgi:hypothetical protein
MVRDDRSIIKRCWAAGSGRLADWTLARLFNRYYVAGGYYNGGQVTRRVTVNHAFVARHYRAAGAGDITGAHTADADNRSKGGALDIDQHGDDPVRAEINRLAVLHWYGVLVSLGFHPLLTDSNGVGGFHLRLLLAEPIDASRLFHFLRRLTADHRKAGLDRPPEHFPKQADVRLCKKQLGNWLRLPGKHHKREFWSRVWDGGRWLDGLAAVDFILSLKGDPPQLVPDVPPPPSAPARQNYRAPHAGDNLSVRIAAYLRRLPNLAEGQGRDDVAFHFAAFLVRDLALDDGTALEWLERWDSGNAPPKGRECLAEILKNARCYGRRMIGCGLSPEGPRYDRHGHRILRVTAEVY